MKCLRWLGVFVVLVGCNPLRPSGSFVPDDFGGFVEPVSDCSLDSFTVLGTGFDARWSLAPLVNRYKLICESNSEKQEICSGVVTNCETSALLPGVSYKCYLQGENSLGSARCGQAQEFQTIGAFQDQLSDVANWSQVTLRWTSASGVTRYRLKQIDPSGSVVRTLSETAVSPYVVSELSSETTYRFRVTALNETNYRVIDAPIVLTTAEVQGLEIQIPTLTEA
jgi:hypothetical protein